MTEGKLEVREKVLLAGLCEREILFRLEIYDRLRRATAKQAAAEAGVQRSATWRTG